MSSSSRATQPHSHEADDSHVVALLPSADGTDDTPTVDLPPQRPVATSFGEAGGTPLVLNGWGGAAPAVTSVGLAWPSVSLVARGTQDPGAAQEVQESAADSSSGGNGTPASVRASRDDHDSEPRLSATLPASRNNDGTVDEAHDSAPPAAGAGAPTVIDVSVLGEVDDDAAGVPDYLPDLAMTGSSSSIEASAAAAAGSVPRPEPQPEGDSPHGEVSRETDEERPGQRNDAAETDGLDVDRLPALQVLEADGLSASPEIDTPDAEFGAGASAGVDEIDAGRQADEDEVRGAAVSGPSATRADVSRETVGDDVPALPERTDHLATEADGGPLDAEVDDGAVLVETAPIEPAPTHPTATSGDGDGCSGLADGDGTDSQTKTAPYVSRETARPDAAPSGSAPAPADRLDDDDTDTHDDTRKSDAVSAAVQTAPVQAESHGEDGSVRMQQAQSVANGTAYSGRQAWGSVATASYGYDDGHRVDLVDSLPMVDESTPLAFEVAEDARRRISLVGRLFPIPPRTRILTVANQKGGVGKTTTTVNVAAAMAQSGLNVLVLDIDPQGNASTALGIDHHAEIPSLYDVVVDQRPLGQVLQACPDIPNLVCAPATIDLAGAEIELVSLVAREVRLQKALREHLDELRTQGLPRIDYVFIDCPPSLSLLTVNAFVAADEVFIPIQCEYYALEGLSQLLKHVELIRGHLNPALHVSSILLTMYDGRTRLSSQVADEVRAHFPETVLRTTVPRSVRISEAPSHGQTVMTYDPASSGALSYLEAARELAEQVLTWADESQQEERA